LAWRAGSCLTWFLTASPTCADSAVIFWPSPGQGKPEPAVLTFRSARVVAWTFETEVAA
jgi:hypothetical protein